MTPVLLLTTKYYSSTTKYYSSTTKYYPSTTPVVQSTTKYYSSTTPYYSVLQSTTPVLLHQVLHPPQKVTLDLHQVLCLSRKVTLDLQQVLRLPHRMTRMLDPRHIWNVISNARSNKCHLPSSPNTAPATQNDHPTCGKTTPVLQSTTQVLLRYYSTNAPSTKRDTWPSPSTAPVTKSDTRPSPCIAPVTKSATWPSPSTAPTTQSDTWTSPTTAPTTQSDTWPSPSTAPATQNDSQAWSLSHMKRHFQCEEQQMSPAKLTTYCACHAKWPSNICQKFAENRWNVISNARPIRSGSETAPRMIRDRFRQSATRHATEVTFRAPDERFVLKNTTFRAPAIFPNFTKYCAYHEKWHLNFTKYCAYHEKWHLNFTKYCAYHAKWHLNFTKYCACHEKWHLNFTKYCAYHAKWHLNFTKYCAPTTQSDTWTSPSTAPTTQSDTWTSPTTAPTTQRDTWPSPTTAPATQNDSQAWSSSHMKRHFQCEEQQMSPAKLTTYCACHAKWPSNICQKFAENRWNVISNARLIRSGSETAPRMIRDRFRQSATRHATEVTFRAPDERFVLKNTTFRAPAIFPNFTKYCAYHEKWHLNFTKYCAYHAKWHLNFTKYCACHEKWHLNFTKNCAYHAKWHLNFTKYCAYHAKWHLNFTNYCACHAKRRSDCNCNWLYYYAAILIDSTVPQRF